MKLSGKIPENFSNLVCVNAKKMYDMNVGEIPGT